jgi:hypothetical protein
MAGNQNETSGMVQVVEHKARPWIQKREREKRRREREGN